ncbi:hypothetical protein [Bosea thiooxidans]|nr:hypothetical protein [Bosea thiooxidans]
MNADSDCDVMAVGIGGLAMLSKRSILAAIAAGLLLSGCSEENLEKADFNAYFYYPNSQREEYLGLVRGLSACQSAASNRAYSLRMDRSLPWSYICCKKSSKSSCESKHK